MIELIHKVTLGETTDLAPALAWHPFGPVLAWKGAGNDELNVAFGDWELNFPPEKKLTLDVGHTSDRSPALANHVSDLYMAWKGSGNENINVAKLIAYPPFHVGHESDNLQTSP